MKLRNKKTGEVYNACRILFGESLEGLEKTNWKTLKEFCEDWEDIGPTEPLIKDEKIRKAVRVWAEANGITQVSYDAGWDSFRCSEFVISFDYDFDRHDGLEDEKSYTIAELCGEEEE